jgi:hypothetical protein
VLLEDFDNLGSYFVHLVLLSLLCTGKEASASQPDFPRFWAKTSWGVTYT